MPTAPTTWLADESTSTMPACVSSPRSPTMKPHGCELPADGDQRAASRMARRAVGPEHVRPVVDHDALAVAQQRREDLRLRRHR